MGITKDQIVFDPSNPTDGDTGASYLRGADGTVIGNTGDALKVTGSFNVDGSTVALDAASLAALENITVTVDNTELEITNDAGNPIPVTGSFNVDGSTVALDAATLTALENTTVSATDLDIRDLTFATDSLDVSGSTVALDATSLSALENITATISGPVALDAGTLAALESVTVSGTVELGATSLAALEDINATVTGTVELGTASLSALETINVTDGGGSLTVDALDLDIRDLNHATDSITIGDGTDILNVNTDGSINVSAQTPNNIRSSALVANNIPQPVVGTALAGRRIILIQNLGNKDAYIGDSTVTTATGIVVPAGSSAEFPWGENISPFVLTSSSTANLRILETAFL